MMKALSSSYVFSLLLRTYAAICVCVDNQTYSDIHDHHQEKQRKKAAALKAKDCTSTVESNTVASEHKTLVVGASATTSTATAVSTSCKAKEPSVGPLPGTSSASDDVFQAVEYNNAGGESGSAEVACLQQLILPFVLRRLKNEVLSDLPKKHSIVERCSMRGVQKEIYQKELSKFNYFHTHTCISRG